MYSDRDNSNTEKLPEWIVIAGILVLALGLRLFGLEKGWWLDEFATLSFVEPGDLAQTWNKLRSDTHHPLYFVLLSAWAWLSIAEAHLRCLSVLFDVGALVVLMCWVRPIHRRASWVAGLGYATCPLVLRYAQELRPYSLLMLATASCMLVGRRLSEAPHDGRKYVELCLVSVLAIAVHPIAAMVIPATVFYAAVSAQPRQRSRTSSLNAAWLAAALAPCVVLFIYFHWAYTLDPVTAASWWMPRPSFALAASAIQYALGLNLAYAPVGFSTLLVPVLIAAALPCLACLGSSWRNAAQAAPFLAAAVVYLTAVVGYSFVGVPIFYYYTAMPALLPLLAGFGVLVSHIRHRIVFGLWATATLVVVSIFSILWLVWGAGRPIEDWRGVGNALQRDWRSPAVVFASPGFSDFVLEELVPLGAGDEIVAVTEALTAEDLGAHLRWDTRMAWLTYRSTKVLRDQRRFVEVVRAIRRPHFALHVAVILTHTVWTPEEKRLAAALEGTLRGIFVDALFERSGSLLLMHFAATDPLPIAAP